jgi:hypothetical protein
MPSPSGDPAPAAVTISSCSSPGARYSEHVRDGLAIVGATPEAVVDLLGALVADGGLYLVGSLAAGLGNQGSDIDLNMFVADDDSGSVPMMFFLDRRIVDIQFFSWSDPARFIEGLPARTVPLLNARCSIGAAPIVRMQNRLSRWLLSAPFDVDSPPLVPSSALAVVAAALVRGALESLVQSMAAAALLDRAHLDSSVAWRRAGRVATEVMTRSLGQYSTGDKWTWNKASRANISRSWLRAADAAHTEATLARVLEDAGFPALDPLEVSRLEPVAWPGCSVGGRDYLIVAQRRLVTRTPEVVGTVAEADHAVGATAVLDALAERVVTLQAGTEALDEAIIR